MFPILKQTFILLSITVLFSFQNNINSNNESQDSSTETTVSKEKPTNTEPNKMLNTSVYGYDIHVEPNFAAYGFCNAPTPPPCYLPKLVPIGWSKDGKFAYRIEQAHNEGDCKIVILDTRQNKVLKTIDCIETLNEFPQKVYKDSTTQNLLTLLESYGMKQGYRDTLRHIVSSPSNIVKLNGAIYEFSVETDHVQGESSFGDLRKCKEARFVIDKIDSNFKRSQQKFVIGNDDALDADKGDLYTGKYNYVGYLKDPHADRIVVMYFHDTVIAEGDDFAYVLKLYPFDGF